MAIRCKTCGGPSDGRSFCSAPCYLIFPDGREARPNPGVLAYGGKLEYTDNDLLKMVREGHGK